jgi:hypothetical protein
MNELLKALAESDRNLEAPEAVELRLRSAFRKKYARPKWPYFAMAAAAAFVTFFVAQTKPHVPPQVAKTAVIMPPMLEVPIAKPVIRKAIHRRPQPHEVVTEFFPLIEDPPPFERGELLRVSLPASAMRSVGLPVSEDRLTDMVQADVLVGQEGLARAIRFVRYEH